MAGHSAWRLPDGPVHSSVPTAVRTGVAGQPKLLPWSLVMKYRL